MKKVSYLIISVIFFIIMLYNTAYAEFISVNKEKLEETLSNIDIEGEVSVTDDTISVKTDEYNFVVKYDLSDKPTFWCETEISKNISEEEYSHILQSLGMPLTLGYYPVTIIQGVDKSILLDLTYNLITNGYPSNSSQYNANSGEYYGDNILEIAQEMWKNKATSRDEFNTYEWTIETKDYTDTSCKAISTVIVNTEADFSKLKETTKEELNTSNNDSKPLDNEKEEKEVKEVKEEKEVTDNAKNNDVKKLPRSGKTTNYLTIALYCVIIVCTFSIILYFYKIYKENRIK